MTAQHGREPFVAADADRRMLARGYMRRVPLSRGWLPILHRTPSTFTESRFHSVRDQHRPTRAADCGRNNEREQRPSGSCPPAQRHPQA